MRLREHVGPQARAELARRLALPRTDRRTAHLVNVATRGLVGAEPDERHGLGSGLGCERDGVSDGAVVPQARGARCLATGGEPPDRGADVGLEDLRRVAERKREGDEDDVGERHAGAEARPDVGCGVEVV